MTATARDIFREVAKQVHPDVCDKLEASNMMRKALENKNDGNALLRLAREWGLKLNGSFDKEAFNSKADFNKKVYEAVVGAIVVWDFRHNRKMVTVRGVIVKTRTVKKGYKKGWIEFTIYDFSTRQIWKYKTPKGYERFQVVGMADDVDLQLGERAHERVLESKRHRKQMNDEFARVHFQKLGLRPNTSYMSSGVEVLATYKRRFAWFDLVRTTAKCCYIKAWSGDREGRVSIRKIHRVRRERI